MIGPAVRRAAFALAPRTALSVQSARARAHSHRLYAQWGVPALNRALLGRLGRTVRAGPFAGLVLSPATWRAHLGPYLLGTYEAELHPWLSRILERSFAQILDIGAQIGYYAIGLARRFPEATVLAFEPDWWARRTLREMRAANGATRVRVRRACSRRWISTELRPRSLIVSDCEGGERALFGSEGPSALDSATLLIETHETSVPGVADTIRARFAPTHEIRSVWSEPRTPPEGLLDFLPEDQRALAVTEFRPRQEWLLLWPNDGEYGDGDEASHDTP